jgi:hypothetical protein
MTQPTLRIVGSGVAVGAPSMFPAAVATPSGQVVAYSTVPDGWPGGTIGVRRSTDGAANWDEARTVAWPGPGEDAALGALGLTRLRSGGLVLPYNAVTWQPGRGVEDCLLGLRLIESADDGRTWSDPIAVEVDFDRPAVYGEMLELASGELLWPVWGERRKGERWRSALLSSRDGGQRWTVKSTIAFDPDARMSGKYVEAGDTGASASGTADFSRNDDPDFRPHNNTDGFNETSVAQLADGRLLAVLRQQGVDGDQELSLFTAFSADDGTTWSKYERVGFSGMSPALVRLRSGHLLLGTRRFVANDAIEPAVEVRTGSPAGDSWSEPLALRDPHGTRLTAEYQCGYPSIIEEGSGTLLVFFYSYQPGVGRFVAWNRLATS